MIQVLEEWNPTAAQILDEGHVNRKPDTRRPPYLTTAITRANLVESGCSSPMDDFPILCSYRKQFFEL